MIVSVTLENWMSFCNRVTFSMVASKERRHKERIPVLKKYQTRILPIAAIYGGNASGKTNFFLALSFAKNLVVRGTQPGNLIPVEPFQLIAKSSDKPVFFAFELLIDETIWEFSFKVTCQEVLEEKLVVINKTRETVLYHRQGGKPNFDSSLDKDPFLHFAFQGTRNNQLFLTNSVSQQVDKFQRVYDWFNDTLQLIAPDARFAPFELYLDEGHPLHSAMNEILPQLDTGIAHLGSKNIPLENMPLSETLKRDLREQVKEGDSVRMQCETSNERFVVTRKNGELITKNLVTYHPLPDGSEVKFEIHQESDGSQRVIDILPAFLTLSSQNSKRVYVVDEINRSLHTLLTRKLIETYLAHCSTDTRSQLLLTTHDLLLMDQHLFRRDEMWLVERNSDGASSLIAISDYKDVRHDKDVRKSYLQGRLGGIPRILGDCLISPSHVQENQAR